MAAEHFVKMRAKYAQMYEILNDPELGLCGVSYFMDLDSGQKHVYEVVPVGPYDPMLSNSIIIPSGGRTDPEEAQETLYAITDYAKTMHAKREAKYGQPMQGQDYKGLLNAELERAKAIKRPTYTLR